MKIELEFDKGTGIDLSKLALAFRYRSGTPIRYYDDGDGILRIFRDTMGIVGIVRARTWETAYEIVEDEFLPVVPADELHEAYGLSKKEFDDLNELSKATTGVQWPDLAEGYSYQSNSTGTGVVSHDLNGEYLEPLYIELMERLGIEAYLKAEEE